MPVGAHVVKFKRSMRPCTIMHISALSILEVCMGMGIPIRTKFPWESHGNGNNFWAINGNDVMGIKMAHM